MVSRLQTRIPRWGVATMTAAVGIVNLISAVTPSLPERVKILKGIFPFAVRSSGNLFAALSGFFLLVLAAYLLRRKRVAWIVAIGLLGISIASNLVKGLDYEESLLSAVLLVVLIALRGNFTARSDPPSLAQGLKVLVVALLFTLAYGTVGFQILDGRFLLHGQPASFAPFESAWQTLRMFFTEDNAGIRPHGKFATFFVDSIYTVGAVTTAFAVVMLLRPVLPRDRGEIEIARQRATEIVDLHGQTCLARLSLLPDKTYHFSPSGESAIAYAVKGRAAIALGEPIGPLADCQAAIVSFQQLCQQNDWLPAFYQIPPDRLDLYRRLGFQLLQIGEEATVDLHQFSLSGKANQNLRTAVNRLTKEGYRFQLFEPPPADRILTQLKSVSDEWLRCKQGAEKQFSVGWFDPDYLRQCYIGAIFAPDDRLVAFVNLISGYHRSEVTIDLMRHRQDLPSGTMDFLFVSLLQHFQKLGWERFNLSLSPLTGSLSTTSSRRTEIALLYLANHLDRFYHFIGLRRFKEKFRPDWEPRYLAYPSHASLPIVTLGLIRADSGDRLWDYFKPDV